MAVQLTEASRLEQLRVRHKGSEYNLYRKDNEYIYVPFAWATSISRELITPMRTGEKIPFNRVLRESQLAPCMTMKMRLKNEGCALNAQSCGDGKTNQSFWIISQFSPKRTLVVVHRVGLAEQWIQEGNACIGFEPWRAEEPEKVPESARVIIILVHVMEKLPKNILTNIDLLIVDECDRVAGPVHGTNLLSCTPRRVLGLTATPGEINCRDVDPVVGLIYGIKPILPGERKPFKVIRINYPYKPIVPNHWYVDAIGNRKWGPDWSALTNGSACNHKRNIDIVRLVRELINADEKNKVFIFVKFKYHVEYIERILKHIGMTKNENYALVYGNEKDDVACCRVYIGTLSKGEAGFDEKSLKGYEKSNGDRVNHVIFGADVIDSRQGSGRANRSEHPIVWEFLDDNDIIREVHAPRREKWYKENNGIVVTRELEDIELGDEIVLEAPPPRPTTRKPWGRGNGNWRGNWRGRGSYGRGRGALPQKKNGYIEPP